jgi:hypothetical protein
LPGLECLLYTLNLLTNSFNTYAKVDKDSAEADTSSIAAVCSSVDAATFCTTADIGSVAEVISCICEVMAVFLLGKINRRH